MARRWLTRVPTILAHERGILVVCAAVVRRRHGDPDGQLADAIRTRTVAFDMHIPVENVPGH